MAEVGVDLSPFPDAKHLASWAGLCPGNRESAGKRMSGRTRKANRYVKRAMCQAAWAASHTKDTYLSAFYRRMSIRKGSPKAVMALAHHMMLVVHQVLSRKENYVEFGGDLYDQKNKPKTVARLVQRLQKLGYYVSLQEAEPAVAERTVAVTSEPEAASQILDSHSSDQPPLPTKRRPGRPCKCKERGIICKHHTFADPIPLIQQPSAPVIFS